MFPWQYAAGSDKKSGNAQHQLRDGTARVSFGALKPVFGFSRRQSLRDRTPRWDLTVRVNDSSGTIISLKRKVNDFEKFVNPKLKCHLLAQDAKFTATLFGQHGVLSEVEECPTDCCGSCQKYQCLRFRSCASSNASTTNPTAQAQSNKFTNEELDQLLAPIALYPDPLLAQIIPASTFVDDVTEAQRTLNGKSDDNLIANQKWDVSVKSIAHYPQILKMMADDTDWTTSLGQAYVNQPDDITKSIQRLRVEARDAGNLATTPQQEVAEKDNVISIEPAQPEVIYVPEYNPETVYVEEAPVEDPKSEGPSTGARIAKAALVFGAGMMIGSWLNNDYDYYGRGIYYHGWNGGGWVGVNRSYVNASVNRNVYINESYRNINVNRNVVNRNVTNYRTNLSRNATVRNERVTAARVNRQRNTALNPRNGERRVDPNSGRAIEPRGERVGSGGRDASARSSERNTGSRTNDRAKATQNAGDRQRANATPRTQQRSSTPAASSRSGSRRKG